MGNRDIERMAARAKGNIPYNLTMTLGEVEQIRQLAETKDPIELIGMIFRFGFVVGHRATRRGRVKKQL